MSIFILYPQAYSYNYKLCVLCPTLKSVHKNILRNSIDSYPLTNFQGLFPLACRGYSPLRIILSRRCRAMLFYVSPFRICFGKIGRAYRLSHIFMGTFYQVLLHHQIQFFVSKRFWRVLRLFFSRLLYLRMIEVIYNDGFACGVAQERFFVDYIHEIVCAGVVRNLLV